MVKKKPASAKSENASPTPLIGEHVTQVYSFPNLSGIIDEFLSQSFQSLTKRKQFKHINFLLLSLIKEAPEHSFLLPAIIEFMSAVNRHKLMASPFTMERFEFWINHFADLTQEDQIKIRQKIVGKAIPRDAYQLFFPIGGNKTYSGTHFVTAHLSPDMDTTIASFWGWIDAFGARIADGQHVWCLPGGPPPSPMLHVFIDLFGEGIFETTARTNLTITLSAHDLVNKKQFFKEKGETSINSIDHGTGDKAIILIDEKGQYCGDWRSADVELTRQIIALFKSCMHWFENNLHIGLISLFASPQLQVDDIPDFISSIVNLPIKECEPVQEFTDKQKSDLHIFLKDVLGISQGINGKFHDLSDAMNNVEVYEYGLFIQELYNITYSSLFDIQGRLIENRSEILHYIERIIIQLDIAIHSVRSYVERLDVSMKIKQFLYKEGNEQYLTLKSDVEEIRLKMKSFNYLTVVVDEEEDKLFPVGVVWANELRKTYLGTVSLRDFSSQDEVRMASYLSIISIIDHHRASITTSSTPSAIIGDAQSSNVLLAELAFTLNDRYSTGGMTREKINAQLEELQSLPPSPTNIRLQKRLLQRKLAAESPYYIDPQREFGEYLSFLYGILDDTDLMTKVTGRDVICVASLINRLKSIIAGKVVEIVSFDDIPQGNSFAKQAALRILKSPDLYSIYHKIYQQKEKEIEKQILQCGKVSHDLFIDTKEQNGCCRIGQIKLFSSNIAIFEEHKPKILNEWLKLSKEAAHIHPEIDFHLMMISTLPNADEIYKERAGSYDHQDELWFWGDVTRLGLAHLSSFLLSFQNAAELQKKTLFLDIPVNLKECEEIADIFRRQFLPVNINFIDSDSALKPWAILRYPAGTINSRKSMITPYLPKIIK